MGKHIIYLKIEKNGLHVGVSFIVNDISSRIHAVVVTLGNDGDDDDADYKKTMKIMDSYGDGEDDEKDDDDDDTE